MTYEIKSEIGLDPKKGYKKSIENPYDFEGISRERYSVSKPKPTLDEIIERMAVQKIFDNVSKMFEVRGADMTLPENIKFLKRMVSDVYRTVVEEELNRLGEKNA